MTTPTGVVEALPAPVAVAPVAQPKGVPKGDPGEKAFAASLVKKHFDGRAQPIKEVPVPGAEPTAKVEPPKAENTLTEAEQADYEKARNALRWSKVPTSTLNSMEPRDLTKWGLEVAKVRAEADEVTRQRGELLKEKATWEEARKAEPAPVASKDAPIAAKLDIDFKADVAALSKVDPEAGEALASALQGVAHKLQAAVDAKVSSVLKEHTEGLKLDRMRGVVTRLELQDARNELSEKFPQLRDKGKFQSVMDKMAKIGNPNFADYRELMEEASAIVFVNEMKVQSQQDDLANDHRSRDEGQGEKPRVPPSKVTLTPREKERAELKEIMQTHGYSMSQVL